MKVAIVAESFLPSVNGVTNSVLRVLHHLQDHGHRAVVMAPQSAAWSPESPAVDAYAGAPIHWLPSLAVPGYKSLRVSAVGVPRMRELLAAEAPDLVHLAAPFVLGWDAVRAANTLGIPTVAVFQTDVPSYATRYGVGGLEPLLWRRIRDVHLRADRTLAPSSTSGAQLRAHGVPRVHRWARGVDAGLHHPRQRDDHWRASVAAPHDRLVGYVGRLAAEKQVEDLTALSELPGVRLVIIGDGPHRARLRRKLPGAVFTGWQRGPELARMVATLDLVVHPGENDTFGQTVQEAMASAVPVVAVAAGGPLDLVSDGVTGHLYPPGDLARLRATVADLVRDDGRRRRLGRQARASVVPRSWSRMGDLLLDHYGDVVRTSTSEVAA